MQTADAPKELAIGTDAGFQPDKPKYEIEKSTKIVIMPSRQVCVLGGERVVRAWDKGEGVELKGGGRHLHSLVWPECRCCATERTRTYLRR